MRGILARLGIGSAESPDTDAIRRISGQLDRLEPDRARYVAAFAFILSRIANVDHDVTDDEVATMEQLVRERADLPTEQAVLVVQMAKTQQLLFGGTEDFLVTRELLRITTYEQRLAILDCLFAVAASDGQVRSAEADEVGRIARELRVEQTDLSALRSRYRDVLAVRQGLGKPPSTA